MKPLILAAAILTSCGSPAHAGLPGIPRSLQACDYAQRVAVVTAELTARGMGEADIRVAVLRGGKDNPESWQRQADTIAILAHRTAKRDPNHTPESIGRAMRKMCLE